MKREWLVIESSVRRTVFGGMLDPDRERPRGYIPRDVVETGLGIDVSGNYWFSREQSDWMRRHPEWKTPEQFESHTGKDNEAE